MPRTPAGVHVLHGAMTEHTGKEERPHLEGDGAHGLAEAHEHLAQLRVLRRLHQELLQRVAHLGMLQSFDYKPLITPSHCGAVLGRETPFCTTMQYLHAVHAVIPGHAARLGCADGMSWSMEAVACNCPFTSHSEWQPLQHH